MKVGTPLFLVPPGPGVLGDASQVEVGQLVGGHVVRGLRGRGGGGRVWAGAMVGGGGRWCGGTAPALAARQDALPGHEESGNQHFHKISSFEMKLVPVNNI